MTPDELKEARRELGLSQSELAALCRVQSGRTVRRWEAGERDIPGPVVVLLAILKSSPAALKLARKLAEDFPASGT